LTANQDLLAPSLTWAVLKNNSRKSIQKFSRFNIDKNQNHLTFITRLFVTLNLYIMKTLMMALILAATLTGGSIYDFKVPGLDGTDIDFSKYKGKKIMIVNTASMCGNTPQYADLEKLYEKYKDKLMIIGFPANNFGQQEPGSNEEIKEFCTKKYAVTFPMAEKISVRGDDIHPLYKWLVDQSKELAKNVASDNSKDIVWKKFLQDPVIWNFTKFLVDENGNLIAVFHNKVSPMSEEVLKYLN
jgi:glutathione peroxidase